MSHPGSSLSKALSFGSKLVVPKSEGLRGPFVWRGTLCGPARGACAGARIKETEGLAQLMRARHFPGFGSRLDASENELNDEAGLGTILQMQKTPFKIQDHSVKPRAFLSVWIDMESETGWSASNFWRAKYQPHPRRCHEYRTRQNMPDQIFARCSRVSKLFTGPFRLRVLKLHKNKARLLCDLWFQIS